MLTSDRQNEILKIVNRDGSATVADLTEKLSASESTIRRDLIQLDSEG
ncbi:MAG: DeoR family transcriptional regulator, partial [Acutalibacteraceae bacterium]|nr:DeoR family transcriptional regulator [Acutalibacteraceae bacterium]